MVSHWSSIDMTIDREKFLSALLALTLGGAATACKKEPPPEEPAPEPSTGAELPPPEPPPEPEAAAPEPAPVPEVVQTAPTRE